MQDYFHTWGIIHTNITRSNFPEKSFDEAFVQYVNDKLTDIASAKTFKLDEQIYIITLDIEYMTDTKSLYLDIDVKMPDKEIEDTEDAKFAIMKILAKNPTFMDFLDNHIKDYISKFNSESNIAIYVDADDSKESLTFNNLIYYKGNFYANLSNSNGYVQATTLKAVNKYWTEFNELTF